MTPQPASAALDNPGAQRPRYKRSVKNYLINRRFQLKWVGGILLLTVLLFSTLGTYIYQHEKHASDAIMTGLAEMYGQEGADIMADMVGSSDSNVLWVLLGAGGALIVALAGMGIVLTHKVAGPIYALGRSFDNVKRGNWKSVRGVREGDEFQELAVQWSDVVNSLRAKERVEIAELEALCDMESVPHDVKATLRRLVERKREYVD